MFGCAQAEIRRWIPPVGGPEDPPACKLLNPPLSFIFWEHPNAHEPQRPKKKKKKQLLHLMWNAAPFRNDTLEHLNMN